MAKLILSMDGLVLKEISLGKERTTIGRKPHNDIQIDNLAVSGEHAVIVSFLNDSFLEDLGSTNGTLVNGQAVKKHFLQNNDVIELGKYKLKYLNEVPVQTKAADFEKTVILRPGAMKAMSSAPVAAPAPAAAGAPAAAVAPAPAKSFGDTMVNQGGADLLGCCCTGCRVLASNAFRATSCSTAAPLRQTPPTPALLTASRCAPTTPARTRC